MKKITEHRCDKCDKKDSCPMVDKDNVLRMAAFCQLIRDVSPKLALLLGFGECTRDDKEVDELLEKLDKLFYRQKPNVCFRTLLWAVSCESDKLLKFQNGLLLKVLKDFGENFEKLLEEVQVKELTGSMYR